MAAVEAGRFGHSQQVIEEPGEYQRLVDENESNDSGQEDWSE